MKLLRRRRGRVARAAALAALVWAGGCGGTHGGSTANEGPGRTLFRRHCVTCHGPEGAGAQVGTLRVPSLREMPAAGYTDQQLFEQIYKGSSRGMPPFSYTLTDEEIRLLARFVREEIQRRK